MGLCNGTRLIINDLKPHVILAEVITGPSSGRNVFIHRIDNITNDDTLPFKLRRRQFPIKAAFSMTITKSQGQTFSKIGVYLEEPVFSHGNLNGLTLLCMVITVFILRRNALCCPFSIKKETRYENPNYGNDHTGDVVTR